MVPSTVIYNEYLQKVRRYLRHHEMVLGGEHVLLAVSGGVDSIVLLDMISRIAPELKLQIGVAHFDHGLRGEAAHRDASFVVEQAKLRGIKTYVGRGDVKKLASEYKLSIEEAGRKARYAFFKRVAQKHRYSVVMTGHNANDNAETLLMNLLRGSGVKGLAAIPPVRSLMRGVVLARPLLEFEREYIEGYAREMDIEWSEDETNRSPQFLRNRVRAELLPLLKQFNPSIVGTLASTANIMQCLEQYISQTVEHAIERVVTDRTKESLAIKLNQLKHYLPAMQTEIIQRSVSDVFEIPPISYGAIERTLGLMWKESGSKAEIGNGITALRDRETLEVRRELPPPPPVVRTFRAGESVQVGRTLLRTEMVARDVAQPGTISTIEFVDAAKITGELTLRSWKEGDRFRPFGMDGEKKLSDFLIDKKVPLDRKSRILVVANGPEIVWVCGMRLDDRYKITPETEQVLRMEIEVVSDPNQRPPASRSQQPKGSGGRGGSRPQSPLQGPERGGDGRREDRRGERSDEARRDDDRRAAATPDARPRDRREGDRQGESRRADERRPDERRSDERRPDERRSDERRGDERRPDERRSDERRSDERRPDDRRSEDRRPDERRTDARRGDERRSAEGERNREEPSSGGQPTGEQPRRAEPREGRGGESRAPREREPKRDEPKPKREDRAPREPRREERQPRDNAREEGAPDRGRGDREERSRREERPRREPAVETSSPEPQPEESVVMPHGFGDDDYQRGETHDPEPAAASEPPAVEPPPRERRAPQEKPAPRKKPAPGSRPQREPRAPRAAEPEAAEPSADRPASGAEEGAVVAEGAAEKSREERKGGRPRGGRGRGSSKGRAAGGDREGGGPEPERG